MIANFNHSHQKIFGASWKAVVLAFPVVWGKKVGRGDTTERRTYPCTQVHLYCELHLHFLFILAGIGVCVIGVKLEWACVERIAYIPSGVQYHATV
jgi:hypothetical protein